jgi:opacity protein-like surface antigen
MRKVALGFVLTIAFGLLPSPARAQGYFVPSIGWDFGGDAGNCPKLFSDCTDKRTSYGLTAGFLAGGIIGAEEDFSYAPDFFGKSALFASNNVLTLMSNVVVGIPAGPVRPYVSAGVGMLRTRVPLTLDGLVSTTNTHFGYDVGGGVMLLLPHHLGLRGDYRYVRSVNSEVIELFSPSAAPVRFHRVSIGLVLH